MGAWVLWLVCNESERTERHLIVFVVNVNRFVSLFVSRDVPESTPGNELRCALPFIYLESSLA